MNAALNKIDLAQWILSLQDELVIQRVAESIKTIRQDVEPSNLANEYSTYAQVKADSFDFERVKAEQNIKPFAEGELDALIEEADIQEPIEVLLASID